MRDGLLSIRLFYGLGFAFILWVALRVASPHPPTSAPALAMAGVGMALALAWVRTRVENERRAGRAPRD